MFLSPRWLVLFGLLAATRLSASDPLLSPNGRIAVDVALRDDGAPVYRVSLAGRTVLAESRLGLVRDDAHFSRGLQQVGSSPVERVEDRYELLTSKRRQNVYVANRQVHRFTNATGQVLEIVFQVSDDGVAFRYNFPEKSPTTRTITEEVSSFHFPRGAKAWLQPMSTAKTGWMRCQPSYEESYLREIDAGTPSPLGAGWVFPALFRVDDNTWVALTETDVGPDYCGSRLRHEAPGGEYTIGFPDAQETRHGQPVAPLSTLPWSTPWRVIALGTLSTVVESTLGTDLAAPARTPLTAGLHPGKASWSWAMLGDAQTTYAAQRRFIDYAAEMGWAYCLIDALWDQQIGYEKVKELADYAQTKGVGLLLWYNSNGDWNDAPQTPKHRMDTPAARRAEFERLRAMGIKGVKIDFFGGDGQPMMQLYHDILRDAEPYGLLLNFHGATLPRGWTRTYPHLLTMEAVKGFEFATFAQADADTLPAHCAMLPFTRNLFEAMDFTPVCLEPLPRGQRRTSIPFELALAVLFTSGLQHYTVTPDGMAKMPDHVRDFMRAVPAVWDDMRFVDGDPGKFVALARRGNGRWFVAGINGESTGRHLELDLSRLAASGRATMIVDVERGGFAPRTVTWQRGERVPVTLAPHGGFVLVIEPAP